MAFTNGAVYTMASAQPQAQAVAINGNKIIAVGSSSSVQSFIGPKTTVIDLQGQMLMPGFAAGLRQAFLVEEAESRKALARTGCLPCFALNLTNVDLSILSGAKLAERLLIHPVREVLAATPQHSAQV